MAIICDNSCVCNQGYLLASDGSCVLPTDCKVATTTVATAPIGGGLKPVNVSSAKVLNAAACIVANLNAQSNNVFQMQLVRVISGTQQVVSGVKYTLVVEVGVSSTCLNNGVVQALAACPLNSEPLKQYQVAISSIRIRKNTTM